MSLPLEQHGAAANGSPNRAGNPAAVDTAAVPLPSPFPVRGWRLPALNLFYVYQLLALRNINSCELLELGGHLDPARLRLALERALARHPVLNSRLRRRFWRAFYTEISAVPLPIDLRVQQCASDREGDVHEALLANIWREPIDVWAGRPVRFHLVETPTRSYLQIVTARLYNDAKAGYRLAHDIAESYSALEAGRPFDTTPIGPTDRTTASLFTRGLGAGRRLRHAIGAVKYLLQDLLRNDAKLATRRVRRGPTDFLKVDLPAEVLGGLQKRARASGVTVHALLALAVLRLWRRTAPLGRAAPALRVLDNFSLRRFARVAVDDVYETFVVPYTLRLPTRGSDDQVLSSASRQLARWKQGEILSELYRVRLYAALARVSPIKLSASLVARFIAKANIVVSNPGPIPYALERFGSVEIADFYNFSQLLPPSRIMLIFSTFRRRLRATVVYDRGAYPDGPTQEVVAPFVDELRRIAGGETARGAAPSREEHERV
jgi:hypothetical protein